MQENSLMTLADFQIDIITPETAAAIDIHNSIIASMKDAASAMVSLCESLKRMRDTKGYESLGFKNFEDYTEKACGIKKRQAYNYIQTYERLGGSFLQSNAQLGITKLQLLTEVCAVDRYDFVEDNDLENMSVTEVKKLVAQAKDQGEQIDLLEDKLKSALDEIKELNSRPVDVAVQQPSDAELQKMVDERTAEMQTEFADKEKALKADYKKKLSAAKDKAQKKAADEKQKAVAEARTAAIEEAKAEFEEKIKSAEQEKADALKKAEQMAARLDKNADADLVKASLYFTEAQKQLESFSASLNKIKESDPDKADKLKQVVVNFLKEFIER